MKKGKYGIPVDERDQIISEIKYDDTSESVRVNVDEVIQKYRDGAVMPGDDHYGSHLGMKPSRTYSEVELKSVLRAWPLDDDYKHFLQLLGVHRKGGFVTQGDRCPKRHRMKSQIILRQVP